VWRSLPESEMRAVFVVVANVFREQTFQMAILNCNDVIQEITPATPYPTLCNSILPRTFEPSLGSQIPGHHRSLILPLLWAIPPSETRW